VVVDRKNPSKDFSITKSPQDSEGKRQANKNSFAGGGTDGFSPVK